jgi:hypothetical protein
MEEVTVSMPLHLTHDLIKAVRNNDLTKCENKDEMNTRIGWLICAYDAMVEQRTKTPNANAAKTA